MSVTTLAPSVYAEISSPMDGLKAADSAPVLGPSHCDEYHSAALSIFRPQLLSQWIIQLRVCDLIIFEDEDIFLV